MTRSSATSAVLESQTGVARSSQKLVTGEGLAMYRCEFGQITFRKLLVVTILGESVSCLVPEIMRAHALKAVTQSKKLDARLNGRPIT